MRYEGACSASFTAPFIPCPGAAWQSAESKLGWAGSLGNPEEIQALGFIRNIVVTDGFEVMKQVWRTPSSRRISIPKDDIVWPDYLISHNLPALRKYQEVQVLAYMAERTASHGYYRRITQCYRWAAREDFAKVYTVLRSGPEKNLIERFEIPGENHSLIGALAFGIPSRKNGKFEQAMFKRGFVDEDVQSSSCWIHGQKLYTLHKAFGTGFFALMSPADNM